MRLLATTLAVTWVLLVVAFFAVISPDGRAWVAEVRDRLDLARPGSERASVAAAPTRTLTPTRYVAAPTETSPTAAPPTAALQPTQTPTPTVTPPPTPAATPAPTSSPALLPTLAPSRSLESVSLGLTERREVEQSSGYDPDLYYEAGFVCSGSMRPYITCADEAIWLAVPSPEDITVGDVISFDPPAECGFAGERNIAHRVIDKRQEDGAVSYRTQGDNNYGPDPCWVPHDTVDGLLVELREDACPQCVIDTAEYDDAVSHYKELRARYDELVSQYDSLEPRYEEAHAAYEARGATYDAKYEQYCGFPPTSDRTCTLDDESYEELAALYDELEAARQQANSLVDELNGLSGRMNALAADIEAAWAEVARLQCELFQSCA